VTETAPRLQPLYLLADSQLLFWKRQDRLLLEAALDGLARDTPLNAAYIGTSNGDRPEFTGRDDPHIAGLEPTEAHAGPAVSG
jgi:cyanophycinase